MLSLLLGTLSAFLISFCFALIYNVHPKRLVAAGLNGMAGTACMLLISRIWGVLPANVLAGVIISVMAELLARHYHSPAITFSIAALIPLVPGGGIYQTMLATIQGHGELAGQYATETLKIAACLVVGLLLATSLRTLWKRKPPSFSEEEGDTFT